jgi:hypothetical protein
VRRTIANDTVGRLGILRNEHGYRESRASEWEEAHHSAGQMRIERSSILVVLGMCVLEVGAEVLNNTLKFVLTGAIGCDTR